MNDCSYKNAKSESEGGKYVLEIKGIKSIMEKAKAGWKC